MNIEQCIKELTLEEKINLLEGADMGFTNSVFRLGIPKILLADGPHGIRVVKGTERENSKPYTMIGEMYESTALPCEAAMAATWNLELLEGAGHQIGLECQEYGVGVILGPGVDGKRSPLGGRNFEYYSEDPYLSGKMAAAFIRGVQSEGVGACLKHYVLNDQETRRTSVDVHVDERTFWEIYLKPFEIAIKEAGPWSIMASYNRVEGTYLCQNKILLSDILRDKLQFSGAILSDWSAVKDKVESHKNGLDLQMPGPSNESSKMIAAVRSGELSEEILDTRVRYVLELVDKVVKGEKEVKIDWSSHHKTAVQLAAEGMVLLKNAKKILPLREQSHIAVIGELAKNPNYTGGGSSSLTPRQLDVPLDSICLKAEVSYAEGYHGQETDEELIKEALNVAKSAETIIVFIGANSTEGLDRTDIMLPEAHIRLVHALAKEYSNIVAVVQCGSAVEYRQIENKVKGILHAWVPGEGGGNAIADLLFGVICPSGKLSESFPVSLANTPAYQYFPGYKDDVYYYEGLLTGYRYYDTMEIEPQYPFGFGLSYTEFEYTNLTISKQKIYNKENVRVTLDVTNMGNYAGKEVVQIYVEDIESHMFRPKKELKGFVKVLLKPGQTKTVEVELEESAFTYYVPHLGRFAVESGIFKIMAGASSKDIRLCAEILFESEDEVRVPLGYDDRFCDFLKDNRYSKYAQEIMDLYQISEGHMFYELFYGASLRQLPGLLKFVGGDEKVSYEMIENLVEGKQGGFYESISYNGK